MTDDARLQPLRVPGGWSVLLNDFFATMTPDDLKEDLLQLRHERADRLLDLGWYPDGDPNGSYALYLYEGDFGGRRLHAFRSVDQAEVVREIERLLHAAP